MNNPAVAAIEYALNVDEPEAFLRCWFEGNFDALRNEWDAVPEEVFIGADPLHPETKRMLAEADLVPSAWLDDGACRSGSHSTAHRVITDSTKRDMPESVAAAFSTPLFKLDNL